MAALTSFMTQFARRSKHYPNAEVSRRVHSKTALERRLVLPLDSGHWLRALEVLMAGYAVNGRSAYHVLQVLECMVPHTTSLGREQVPVVDALRDCVYDGALPSSPSLWVGFVNAYGRLGALDEALETVGQWKRRSATASSRKTSSLAAHSPQSSSGYWQPRIDEHRAREVCATLLPLLAAKGRTGDMHFVLNALLAPVDRQAPQYQQWLREAAAMRGDWRAALTWATAANEPTSRSPTCETSPSVPAAEHDEVRSFVAQAPSLDAIARVVSSMASEGRWPTALAMYQLLMERTSPNATSTDAACVSPTAIMVARRTLMNQLGNAGQWAAAMALMHNTVAWHNTLPRPGALLDRELVALFFHVLAAPQRVRARSGEAPLPLTDGGDRAAESAARVIHAMDALCCHSDDWRVDNVVGALCTEALVHRGDWVRALHFIGSTPLLQGRAGPSQPSSSSSKGSRSYLSADKAAEQGLVQLLYYLHGSISEAAKAFTLRKYPHAFPKEVFRSMPPPGIVATPVATSAVDEMKPLSAADVGESDDDVFEGAVHQKLSPTAPRVPWRAGGPTTTRLAEHTERVLRERILEVEAGKWRSRFATSSYGGGDANPHDDPRPIPLGLHDTTNGWNHVGRGGQKIFSNNGGAHANLLSTHPKHMPLLKDPLRSWNPKKNSSWAHLSAVRKWNGRSAV